MNNHVNYLRPTSIQARPEDVSAPTTANTPAVVHYPIVSNQSHCISGIAWSYVGGKTVDGNLSILDGAAVVFSMDITSGGSGFLPFEPFKHGTYGNPITIMLTPGGHGIKGKVSVLGHWTH